MNLGITCLVGCVLMFLICYLALGSDDKNIKSFHSYGSELQSLLINNPDYKDKIKKPNNVMIFISNTITFLIIMFIFGIFIRKPDELVFTIGMHDYLYPFLSILILGEVMNAFDFLIIDCLWFTHTKRSRFSQYQDQKLYKDVKNHFLSFIKGSVMFLIVASIDAAILMTF